MNVQDKKTVLVVDDEAGICEILQSELEDAGYRVFTACSGQAAIKIVDSEDVDLILSDIRMPNGTGVQLLQLVRDKNPDYPPLLFLSGFSDITLEEAFNLGAEGIMSKPWDPEELLKAVDRLAAKVPVRWKRSSDRIEVSWTIRQSIEGAKNVPATVANIGYGGMFVASSTFQPKFEEHVEFSFQDGELAGVSGKGSVRWIRAFEANDTIAGYGLEFLMFNSDGQGRLDAFLQGKNAAKKPEA